MENKQELFEKAPVWKAYFIISLPAALWMKYRFMKAKNLTNKPHSRIKTLHFQKE